MSSCFVSGKSVGLLRTLPPAAWILQTIPASFKWVAFPCSFKLVMWIGLGVTNLGRGVCEFLVDCVVTSLICVKNLLYFKYYRKWHGMRFRTVCYWRGNTETARHSTWNLIQATVMLDTGNGQQCLSGSSKPMTSLAPHFLVRLFRCSLIF